MKKIGKKQHRKMDLLSAYYEGCLEGMLWAEVCLLRMGKATRELRKTLEPLRKTLIRRIGPVPITLVRLENIERKYKGSKEK